MQFKTRRLRKHLHTGTCPECGRLFTFRARWRVEDEYENHRLQMHPTFIDVIRSTTAAMHRFSEAFGRA